MSADNGAMRAAVTPARSDGRNEGRIKRSKTLERRTHRRAGLDPPEYGAPPAASNTEDRRSTTTTTDPGNTHPPDRPLLYVAAEAGMDVCDLPGLRTSHEPMPNLLVTTPDYLLRYDVDTRHVFVVDTGRPEYYGVSWRTGAGGVYLSHSGLNNNALRSVEDYANSERGYVSLGGEASWEFLSAPHQMVCVGPDRIVATNTGRNCVTVANTDDWSIRHHRFDEVLWDRLGEADRSGSHFNSVLARDGLLYVVAHNFEKGSYTLSVCPGTS